jgi:hypothetical protein
MYSPDPKQNESIDPVTGTSPELMQRAKREYAEAHHLSGEQADKADPTAVVCWFYFEQWKIAYDEMYKLQGLEYPAMLAKSDGYAAKVEALTKAQPANPFFKWLPTVHKGVVTFAKLDRQVAALSVVEAIRSYSAEHGGALPAKLDEITETPAPLNPATGKQFEYQLQDGGATLTDENAEMPMRYTIKIKK